MANFRIAQVSDLHFGHTADWINPTEHAGVDSVPKKIRAAFSHIFKQEFRGDASSILYPSTFSADVAQALLADLSRKSSSLDALVVTGDLATTGEEADLTLARGYFEGNVPAEWNPIGGLPSLSASCQIITLPGNHDRYDGVALLPMSKRFEGIFGEEWDLGAGGVVSSPDYGDRVRVATLVKGGAALVICMGDFCLDGVHDAEGNFGWVGQGRAYPAVVEAMVRASSAARRGAELDELKTAVVWAVHFPPSFPKIEELLALQQDAVLVDGAHIAGASLIMAGHTHTPLTYLASTTDGQNRVRVYCCGSSTGMSKDNLFSYTYFEIQVGDDLAINTKNFTWNFDAEEFLESITPGN